MWFQRDVRREMRKEEEMNEMIGLDEVRDWGGEKRGDGWEML